jgi:hypothetical protein
MKGLKTTVLCALQTVSRQKTISKDVINLKNYVKNAAFSRDKYASRQKLSA